MQYYFQWEYSDGLLSIAQRLLDEKSVEKSAAQDLYDSTLLYYGVKVLVFLLSFSVTLDDLLVLC